LCFLEADVETRCSDYLFGSAPPSPKAESRIADDKTLNARVDAALTRVRAQIQAVTGPPLEP
jgi:hypothetical protein